jgi:hypothetical protein
MLENFSDVLSGLAAARQYGGSDRNAYLLD